MHETHRLRERNRRTGTAGQWKATLSSRCSATVRKKISSCANFSVDTIMGKPTSAPSSPTCNYTASFALIRKTSPLSGRAENDSVHPHRGKLGSGLHRTPYAALEPRACPGGKLPRTSEIKYANVMDTTPTVKARSDADSGKYERQTIKLKPQQRPNSPTQ